jgi:hypothetical protein
MSIGPVDHDFVDVSFMMPGTRTLQAMRNNPVITEGIPLAASGRRVVDSSIFTQPKLDRQMIRAAYGLDVKAVEPLDPFPTFWPPLETLAAFQTANRRRNMREDHETFSFGDGLCAVIGILFVFFLLGAWLGVL